MTFKHRNANTTLENVIYQLALSTATDQDLAASVDTLISTTYANDKQWLLSLIYEETRYLEKILGRAFVPFKFTWTLPYLEYGLHCTRDDRINAIIQSLPYDLLSITSYTWVTTALTTSDYYTRPVGQKPIEEIAIYGTATLAYPSVSTESVALVGVWGYHTDPDNMWEDSGDTVQNGSGIDADDTSITVTDANAIATNGFTRFQHLQYIQIDSEWMQITAVNTSTNVLTVKRGVNGTTAAAHDNDAAIDVYVPDDLITQATRRLVVQRFRNPSEQRVIQTTPEGSTIQIADETIHLPPKRYYMGSA